MISKAGGMTPAAAAKIIFVPADGGVVAAHGWGNATGIAQNTGSVEPTVDFTNHESLTDHNEQFLGSARGKVQSVPILSSGGTSNVIIDPLAESASTRSALKKLQPIIIAISDSNMRDYLELPARPGDTLIIPAAGEVTVGGWVRNPGGFPITPGMTALSAISAAGGALFSSSAQVLRTASDGERSTTPINISHIQNGEEADVPVQSGDVVRVDKSALGAFPYAAYTLLSKFGTGMYLPVP
jgi:protein involved in polysaccharide export with SLBB domain